MSPTDQQGRGEAQLPTGSDQVQEYSETNLRKAADTTETSSGGWVGFVMQKNNELSTLEVKHRTDWDSGMVEDTQLTYSDPRSAFKFTRREASSAGFTGVGGPGFGLNETEESALTPPGWGAGARSQRIDWTLLDTKNFGVTAFGYQNEVGFDFKPFGKTKSEFAIPGTTTLKTGGELRVGPFGFGFAQSSVTKLYDRVDASPALQQEASVTVDLPRLLPFAQGSSVSKLIPTLWLTGSDRQTPGDVASTLSTGVGGSWTFDHGYASFGAWTYSSDGNDELHTAWSGHGFDGNLGAHYAALAVDVSLSYGQSAERAPYSQSAGDLYNSSLSLSYTPAELPGVWAAVATGNYDQNAISFGSTASEMYSEMYSGSMRGEYWSVGGGLDLTNWVCNEQQKSEQTDGTGPSVKLLYRYTDAFELDSSDGALRNKSHFWAMMIQRKF